jgi:hypothetical protein
MRRRKQTSPGPGTRLHPPAALRGHGELASKISLKAAARIPGNPVSPCAPTADPSLRPSSRTSWAQMSVVPRCLLTPSWRRKRWIAGELGGIVSSQGRSFGTPALGPCREPGGQLGASTPRLAPFSYWTAPGGWSLALCPRQGRTSRADMNPCRRRDNCHARRKEAVCRQLLKLVRCARFVGCRSAMVKVCAFGPC